MSDIHPQVVRGGLVGAMGSYSNNRIEDRLHLDSLVRQASILHSIAEILEQDRKKHKP